MQMTQGLFVTGTDTGVGKTLVAAAMIRLLRERGVDAVGFKPAATGVNGGAEAEDDARVLADASDGCEPLDTICPLRFKRPLAPTMAARAEGLIADAEPARRAFRELCRGHSAVIAEGVGGLLAPLDARTLVLDFAAETGFPILVVCRAALGTINHTLLTLREIQRARLPLAGVVMNLTQAEDADVVRGTKEEIERIGAVRITAVIPYLAAGEREIGMSAMVRRAAEALASQVDVTRLIR